MITRDKVIPIAQFLGVNRRDGADLVQVNEFFTLQNVYQKTRGLFYKRTGTTESFNASALPLSSQILGWHRQQGVLGDIYSLLYCEASGTIARPTTAPVLSDITSADGDLFNGSPAASLSFSYTWVGCGYETPMYVATLVSITPASNTNKVRVTLPAFPAGVVSANIYISTPNLQWNIIGVVTTSAGHVDVSAYVGPNAARHDAQGIITCATVSGGNLKKGVYYISAAWYVDDDDLDITETAPTNPIAADQYAIISVPDDNYSITVQDVIAAAASTNGATFAAVFIGVKPPTEAPMIFAGMVRAKADATAVNTTNTLTITTLPSQLNFLTYPGENPGNRVIRAHIHVNGAEIGTGAYLTRLNSGNVQVQVFFPRLEPSGLSRGGEWYDSLSPFTGGAYVPLFSDSGSVVNTSRRRALAIGVTPYFASFLGLTFIANNYNLLLQCDGVSVSEVREVVGTIHPGYPSQVIVFKDQLVMTVNTSQANSPAQGNKNANQVYGSNALNPYNWAAGGTGTALRFASIGDPFGDGVTALGVFSFTTNTDGPRSYLLCLKKSYAYLLSNVPDPASGIAATAETLSAKAGCVAPRTIINTPLGTMYLGSDGDVYLIAGTGEPRRMGTKVQSELRTLVEDNPDLMALPSAVYHDNQYKLAYPYIATVDGVDYDEVRQLWLDLRTDQNMPTVWSGPHRGVSIGQQILFDSVEDDGNRYCLSGDGYQILKLDDSSTFQDLGVAIDSVIEWKTSRMGDPMTLKRIMSMFFDLYYDTTYSHSVLLEGFAAEQYSQKSVVLSTGTGVWNSSSWDASNWGSAQYSPVPISFGPDNLLGRTFKWKFTHSNNAQLIMASAMINFQPERRIITS